MKTGKDQKDFFLTKEEEREVEETLKQREKGELLTMKEVFGG